MHLINILKLLPKMSTIKISYSSLNINNVSHDYLQKYKHIVMMNPNRITTLCSTEL